jgi:hypothetical protein
MSKYVYDISKELDFKNLLLSIDDISKIFESEKFKKFVAEKCIKELETIMGENLNDIPEYHVSAEKVQEYKNNNKYEIGTDYVLIFNETNLTQGEMYWVSDKTKERYPEGISISYLIEYGTGLRGTAQDDWEVNVSSPSKRSDGKWTFKKDDIVYKKVSGLAGRFIYDKLLQVVENNMQSWIDEYLEKNKEK